MKRQTMKARRSIYLKAMMTLGVTALSFLGLTSCREEIEVPETYDKNGISLIVTEAKEFQTRSTYKDLLFSDGSHEDVYLEIIESDICNEIADTLQPATKAAPYSGNNIGAFKVVTYRNDSPFFEIDLTSDGSVVSTGYYWPITSGTTKIDFFGYARSNSNGTLTTPSLDPSANTGTFTYTLPDPAGDNTAAVEQPDLVFAISPDRTNTGSAVPMTFHHALSAIVFATENVPSQFKVESVSFTNICSKADCSFALNGSAIDFDWNNAGTKKTFAQNFEEEVGGSTGKPVNTVDETFMMIPQSIGADAKFTIIVSFEDRKYTIEKDLATMLATWKPGKKYTFKISSPEEVKIELTETFTEHSNKKENVFFTNTGLSTIKVRAAIVGYWVVKATINGEMQECIIADWDPENDGTFVGLPGSGWTQSSDDGFYYYSSALAPKGKTSNLFTSYTLNGTPPVVGAELVLTIIGQSIISGYEDSTWNN